MMSLPSPPLIVSFSTVVRSEAVRVVVLMMSAPLVPVMVAAVTSPMVTVIVWSVKSVSPALDTPS